MNNFKIEDLVVGEVYYQKPTGYSYEYVFIFDGNNKHHPLSGPYYMSKDSYYGKNYCNPFQKNDEFRLATFSERELLLEGIKKNHNPKYEYIIQNTSNQYEIY